MPKAGTPASKSPGSTCGAPGAYTLDGPPERTTAAGLRARISSAGTLQGTISEYTPASRRRRAMSWAYCAPKSTTRTVGKSTGSAPDALPPGGPLPGSPSPDHEVDPLEFLEVAVAGLGHHPAQRPEQVGPPVGGLGRAEQHLLERPGRRQRCRRATAGQPGVRRPRVPPAAAGRDLAGDPQRLPQLDGVRPTGQRPRDGATGLDPAVCDH